MASSVTNYNKPPPTLEEAKKAEEIEKAIQKDDAYSVALYLNGVNLNKLNPDIFISSAIKTYELWRYIIDYQSTPLHWAMQAREWTIFNALIERKAYGNAIDKDGSTPLHIFARICSEERKNLIISKAKLLLELGADINAADKAGDTPLHIAALWKAPGEAKAFLRNNGAVETKNNGGHTPCDIERWLSAIQ